MSRPYQQSTPTQAVGFGRLEAAELPHQVSGHQPRINYVMRQARVAEAITRDGDNATFAAEQIPTLFPTANGNMVLRLNASKKGKKGGAKNSLIITPNGRVVFGHGTVATDKEYLPPGSLQPAALKTLYQSGLNEQAEPTAPSNYGDALFGGGHYYMPKLNTPQPKTEQEYT